jgi:IclR family transcriptional regulator, acetate operon repressor
VLRRGLELPKGYGKNAVRSIAELLKQLSEIRRNGYALALESGELGIHAIAVAFPADTHPAGPAVGTLSIAGPAFRLGLNRLTSFLPHLKEASMTISGLWPLRPRGQFKSAVLAAEAGTRESA